MNLTQSQKIMKDQANIEKRKCTLAGDIVLLGLQPVSHTVSYGKYQPVFHILLLREYHGNDPNSELVPIPEAIREESTFEGV
jgi:hypothetical protein